MTNQWQLNGTNLVDGSYGGAYITGSKSNVLTIIDLTTNVQGSYHLVVSNPKGSTNSVDATLTIVGNTVPPPSGNVVGAWLLGATNLADVSGYQPAHTHDGYGVKGASIPATGYTFTNDVPPGATGSNSLWLYAGNTAIAISNSSTLDVGYTNTFDDTISNSSTVVFWAKGTPTAWTSMVSKDSEGDPGAWAIRGGNAAGVPTYTVKDGGAGGVSLGYAPFGNDDNCANYTIDKQWHFYAGTFDAPSGLRNLYVDGVLVAQETNNVPYNLCSPSHLAFGSTERPASAGANAGFGFNGYYTGEIYGVQIYKTALNVAQVNYLIPQITPPAATPTFTGGPAVINGHQLVLTWSGGTLLQATNLTGPWIPAPGATSPYTNDVTASPQLFFRVSYP
jgi:hypothetical protein